MKQISKEEANYLIRNKFVKCEKGRYPDITITCRDKSKGKRKKRYVNKVIWERYLKGKSFQEIISG